MDRYWQHCHCAKCGGALRHRRTVARHRNLRSVGLVDISDLDYVDNEPAAPEPLNEALNVAEAPEPDVPADFAMADEDKDAEPPPDDNKLHEDHVADPTDLIVKWILSLLKTKNDAHLSQETVTKLLRAHAETIGQCLPSNIRNRLPVNYKYETS